MPFLSLFHTKKQAHEKAVMDEFQLLVYLRKAHHLDCLQEDEEDSKIKELFQYPILTISISQYSILINWLLYS